jgi:hypothetical protein
VCAIVRYSRGVSKRYVIASAKGKPSKTAEVIDIAARYLVYRIFEATEGMQGAWRAAGNGGTGNRARVGYRTRGRPGQGQARERLVDRGRTAAGEERSLSFTNRVSRVRSSPFVYLVPLRR